LFGVGRKKEGEYLGVRTNLVRGVSIGPKGQNGVLRDKPLSRKKKRASREGKKGFSVSLEQGEDSRRREKGGGP